MTEFIPGAGPPPHRIPSFTPPSFQPRGDPTSRPAPDLAAAPLPALGFGFGPNKSAELTRSNTAFGIESQEFAAACDLKPLAVASTA